MRVTLKGQVTIPASVRRQLHLQPGDEVRFVNDGDRIVLEKQSTESTRERGKAIDDWLSDFAGAARNCPWTTDDILDMTRGSDRRRP